MEDVGEELSKVLESKRLDERYSALMQKVLDDRDVRMFIEAHREQVTDEDIQKSYAKLYEFVQEKKKYQLNDPSMIAPGYEPKLFLNFHYIDVTYVPTETLLKRQAEEQIRSRVRSMNMPKDVREASVGRLDMTSDRSKAIQALLDFIDVYTATPTNFHQGLYLQGSFGVGKTYMLGALANALAERGYRSTLVHFPTFAVEMKQAIGKDTMLEKLETIKKSPILMLDDIGADSMSSWIRDDVLGVILQYRMQEQLPTFFTSNFSMQQLESEHLRVSQRGEEEPLKAKRIMERIRYLSKEIVMVGKNRRNP
ncbi:primosomal protein DnaI [Vagococcus entomophilus]|uniref:Primosomal protein DnaI n=1 Tax=Vagococcus entomophilus TaxID=1160095 RepID=A0A430AJV9_9ENTE|nr:primosomal protein DnaI [Vagococcus entomophilus]RSU08390.1 primosomal protein DnaI [Vagococcus entomophilus]